MGGVSGRRVSRAVRVRVMGRPVLGGEANGYTSTAVGCSMDPSRPLLNGRVRRRRWGGRSVLEGYGCADRAEEVWAGGGRRRSVAKNELLRVGCDINEVSREENLSCCSCRTDVAGSGTIRTRRPRPSVGATQMTWNRRGSRGGM